MKSSRVRAISAAAVLVLATLVMPPAVALARVGSTVDVNGHYLVSVFENGCWEPMVVQLPD